MSFLTNRLPRIPRTCFDTRPPPFKTGYYAYHRYFSGKKYDFVCFLVSVSFVTNRLPRIRRICFDTRPPTFKTGYYAYHRYFSCKMYDFLSISVSVSTLTNRIPRVPDCCLDYKYKIAIMEDDQGLAPLKIL